MVNDSDVTYQYTMANEEELDALLRGQVVSGRTHWTQSSKPPKPRPGSVGVIWRLEDSDLPIKPLTLVINEDDIRRLCGRYAQLHGDLSPLTAWCHLLTPRFFEPLDSLARIPDLGGLLAAWAGLTIAEAVLIAERPLASIKISACWATHSFAVARTNALWNHLTTGDITRRFDHVNRLFKADSRIQGAEGRAAKIRTSLQPIWEALIGLSQGRGLHRSGELEPIISALKGLIEARSAKDPKEASQLVRPLLHYIPEADSFEWLEEIAPEGRLKIFDKLVEALDGPRIAREELRRNGLALLAGYLATIAAGGSPSLGLAEGHASRWPEITAWAYVMGGLGEKIVWTSSFDGLGRLVARELQRPLHLDEPPTCDFAFEEAEVLIDAKLTDPLVHLKVKQARLLTVQVFPGVNVAVSLSEQPNSQSFPKPDSSRTVRALENTTRDPIGLLVDVMWPNIKARLDAHLEAVLSDEGSQREEEGTQRNRGKRKSGTPQLPFGSGQKKH
jgi:hypothetical protein